MRVSNSGVKPQNCERKEKTRVASHSYRWGCNVAQLQVGYMLHGQVNNRQKVLVSPPPRLKLCSDSRSFWTESLRSPAKTSPRLSGPRSPKCLSAPACFERGRSESHWGEKWAKVSRAHVIPICRRKKVYICIHSTVCKKATKKRP